MQGSEIKSIRAGQVSLAEAYVQTDGKEAWLMSAHDVSRLPVVDRGRLVGIVSRADLVRYFSRPDGEIEMFPILHPIERLHGGTA